MTTGTATAATITCDTCAGTGHDNAFNSQCAICDGYGQLHPARPALNTRARQGEITARAAASTCTDKQIAFADRLGAEYLALTGAPWEGLYDRATKAEASAHIDALLAALRDARNAVTAAKADPEVCSYDLVNDLASDLPAGSKDRARFAVTGDNRQTVFVIVDRPSRGRWAGKAFVKTQAGPNEHRTSPATAVALLRKILEDPAEAFARYGRELGECGVCGLPLTDAESRAAGIGPVCRAKF